MKILYILFSYCTQISILKSPIVKVYKIKLKNLLNKHSGYVYSFMYTNRQFSHAKYFAIISFIIYHYYRRRFTRARVVCVATHFLKARKAIVKCLLLTIDAPLQDFIQTIYECSRFFIPPDAKSNTY